MSVQIIRGNALDLPLADSSVDLIVTSPPYFGLRSYQDGGEHYDGQIGDEDTPAEFVDALIAATREMVRVTKPTGSIWVNLGDRYSDGTPLDNELTVGDAGWLAGLIDADGTITVRRTQQKQMRAPTFEGIISVEQMDRDAVARCRAVTGLGQVHEVNGSSRGRTMYRWTVSTQQARWVAERIWPFLRIKHRQAKAIVELGKHREQCQARGRHTPISPEWVEYRQLICDAVRAWNRREPHGWEPPALPVVDLPLRPRFLPAKSLAGVPWRYAIRCIDELGLILRAEVIWAKANGLPESVTDRVRRSHETWFHFTLNPRYYSAVDEVREPHAEHTLRYYGQGAAKPQGKRPYANESGRGDGGGFTTVGTLGKLPGSVWTIATEPLRVPDHLGVDHFAAFPTEWPRRIITGWSPRGVCVECGEGRRPVVDRERMNTRPLVDAHALHGAHEGDDRRGFSRAETTVAITGEACDCPEPTAPTTPGVVLDPFGGTGTTALVADALGRHGISVDMSADYCRLARWRTTDPKQRAKAAQKPYTPPAEQIDGQGSLLDLIEETA